MNTTQLDRLNQIAGAATALAEVVRKQQTLHFHTPDPTITLYIHAEQAEVRVLRHDLPEVECTILLQVPFAWRLAAEQDDAGIYLVARRRPIIKAAVAGFAGAVINVVAPRLAHVIVRIDTGRLVIENADDTFDLPGQRAGAIVIQP